MASSACVETSTAPNTNPLRDEDASEITSNNNESDNNSNRDEHSYLSEMTDDESYRSAPPPLTSITTSTRHTAPITHQRQHVPEIKFSDLPSQQETSATSTPPIIPTPILDTPLGEMPPDATNVTTNTKLAATDSKYQNYHLMVDRTQDDKAVEIALFTAKRPHMRAFHYAWVSFFVAFFTWFAIAPLLSEVAVTLKLSKENIWTSNIMAVAGTAVVRATIGPFCDKYGARVCTVVTLVASAIPALALCFVQDSVGLSLCRLVVGVGGGTFVTGQYWTSSMFTREVVGTANALVAGWGNLGGGVTQVVMGSVLFPLFKLFFKTDVTTGRTPEELAWRTVLIVPALMSFITAYFIFCHSDDSPKGNYEKRTREGLRNEVSTLQAMKTSLADFNTWLLFIQYACCFGVEITMSNAAALYFKHEFDLTTETAAAIASVFGWMNLFARGFGGFVSDISNAWKGMQGRLVWHFVTLLMEGVMVIIFANTRTLAAAICVMCVFSIFVQAAEGSTYGIVPYVKPKITGSIAGLVGAGGTVGGVFFSVMFRQFDYRRAFMMMGYTIIASSVLTGIIFIRGHKGCICGQDAEEIRKRISLNMMMDGKAQINTIDREGDHNDDHQQDQKQYDDIESDSEASMSNSDYPISKQTSQSQQIPITSTQSNSVMICPNCTPVKNRPDCHHDNLQNERPMFYVESQAPLYITEYHSDTSRRIQTKPDQNGGNTIAGTGCNSVRKSGNHFATSPSTTGQIPAVTTSDAIVGTSSEKFESTCVMYNESIVHAERLFKMSTASTQQESISILSDTANSSLSPAVMAT